MKTNIQRLILSVLLLAAGINGVWARDFYVGSGENESTQYHYKTLEALMNVNDSYWQTTNTVHITSNLEVSKKITLTHPCSIVPQDGDWTISAASSFGDTGYNKSNSAIIEVRANVTLNSFTTPNYPRRTYFITIQGLGGDYAKVNGADTPEDWTDKVKFARCVTVANGATFTFTAGTLTNGYGFHGGGIYMSDGTTVNMNGADAKITGCSAEQGGGVYNRGTFNFSAGEITKNAAWADNRAKIENNKTHCSQGTDEGYIHLSLALGGGIATRRDNESTNEPTTNISGSAKITYNVIEDRVRCRENEYKEGQAEDLHSNHKYPAIVPSGAGISIYGGTVNMSGGEICGNMNLLDIALPDDIFFDQVDKSNASTTTKTHNGDWHYWLSGGGGVHVTSYYNATGSGALTGTFNMTGGSIHHNFARRGGGIYIEGKSNTSLNPSNLTKAVYNNGAYQQGGGVFVGASNAKFTATNVQFEENYATDGGGGAIYIFSSDPQTTVSNSQFNNNWSTWSGGAILLDHGNWWDADNAYLHLKNSITLNGNYSKNVVENNANNANYNGNAISDKGKLYLSGTFTLNNTSKSQVCCLVTEVDGDTHKLEHVLFKEGDVTFLDQSGSASTLDVYILDPCDRQNIFVSTNGHNVVESDMDKFTVLNTAWTDMKYFNSHEVEKMSLDIDKTYIQDKNYSGWNEVADASGRLTTPQSKTYVVELHKLGAITVSNDQLSHGESAIYTVKPKDDEPGNVLRSEYKVVLTGTDDKDPVEVSRTIIDVEPGNYIVSEETWNWAYENDSKASGPAWVTAGEEKEFPFTGTRLSPKERQVMYDEDYKTNTFTTVEGRGSGGIDNEPNVNLSSRRRN